MLPGETIRSGASPYHCGMKLKLQICRSHAGFYWGTWCPRCGPYTRESGYYPTREAAQSAWDTSNVNWRE